MGPTMIPVLQTKLHPPPSTDDVVERNQLIDFLDSNLALPLTVIAAPAGYGKSTLASLWLQRGARPAAWLSLDRDDNDLRTFLACLVASVRTLFPNIFSGVAETLAAPRLPDEDSIAISLINELELAPEPFALVLDDFHLIEPGPVEKLLTAVMVHPSPKLHLIILSRTEPRLPLSTLRGRGLVAEIDVSRLRFDLAEATSFLQRALNLSLDPGDIAEIEGRLEGWPAGLRMVAQSMRSEADIAGFLAAAGADTGAAVTYLVSEVLERQTPDIAQHLLELSLLDRFCAPLCGFVHGVDDPVAAESAGAAALEEIRRRNLFVIDLDSEGRWFRFHHLFGQLLRDQLQRRKGGEEVRELHRRAAEWFADHDLAEEAIKHALLAGDIELAVELVRTNRKTELSQDRWYTVKSWLDRFPNGVEARQAQLQLARAWVFYHQFRLAELADVVDRIGQAIRADGRHEDHLGELDFLRGHLAMFQGDGPACVEHLETARRHVDVEDIKTRAELNLHYPLGLQMVGRKDEAVRESEAFLTDEALPQGIRKARYWATLSMIHLLSLEPDKVLDESRQQIAAATACGSRYLEAWGLCFATSAHYLRGERGPARECAAAALELSFAPHRRVIIDMVGISAMFADAAGDEAGLQEHLEFLDRFVNAQHEPGELTLANSVRAHVEINRGAVAAARGWLERSNLTTDKYAMSLYCEIPRLTRCRVLIAESSTSGLREAVDLLAGYAEANRKCNHFIHLPNILAMSAVARQRLGDSSGARSDWYAALTVAAPGKVVQPFLELGSALDELVESTGGDRSEPDFARTVRAALTAGAGVPDIQNVRQPPSTQGLVEPLTNRELDVLELLALRLQNKEIAGKLHISTETVKSHARNVFQKLGASNRREAVEHARRLGIVAPIGKTPHD